MNIYISECLIEENIFFIISPKDLVIATPYDADDRVNWLIRHRLVIFLFFIFF